MYFFTYYPSPVGTLMLAGDEKNLTGLWIEAQKYFGKTLPEDSVQKDDAPVFTAVKEWLDRYFAGEKPAVSELSLAPAGSEFRQNIWKILCEIPYGQVMTYGDIAKRMAVLMNRETMSAQAVGSAVGHNPISIIIPCHRVVGTNGSLTGYAGGIEKKVELLKLEGVDTAGFWVPK